MTANPIDLAIVDNADVAKSDVRGLVKSRVRLRMATVSEVRSTNLVGQYGIYVDSINSNLDLDVTDTTTADDGATCIVSNDGYRFKLISAAGTLLASNNLSDVASASTSRTNLGLGTAAVKNTGTSGNNVPLLDGANTFSAAQTFSNDITQISGTYYGRATFNGGNDHIFRISNDSGSNWRDAITVQWGHSTNGVAVVLGSPAVAYNGAALHIGTLQGVSFMAEYTGSLSTLNGAGIIGVVSNIPTAADQRFGYYLLGSREGSSALANTAGIAGFSGQAWTAGSARGSYLVFYSTSNGASSRTARFRVEPAGNFLPEADNSYTLGNASFRMSAIWAANGTIQTSDVREKEFVSNILFAGTMIDAVEPKLFRWKIGSNVVRDHATEVERDADGNPVLDEGGNEIPQKETVPVPGKRTHAGFFAQDIKFALDAAGVDFGVWGIENKDDPNSRQWTRPDQLIPVLWAALREARVDIVELRARLEVLESNL